jgi:hypothetical protein
MDGKSGMSDEKAESKMIRKEVLSWVPKKLFLFLTTVVALSSLPSPASPEGPSLLYASLAILLCRCLLVLLD